MRLIDASVFVHAFIKPRRELKPHETKIKNSAKRIIARVSNGEVVGITIAQIVEVANILESYLPIEDAIKVEEYMLLADNIKVFDVSKKHCLKAIEIAKERQIGLSDAIALVIMSENSIKEIYSFDSDFDRIDEIKRVTE